MRSNLVQVTEWQWEPSVDGNFVVHLAGTDTGELRVHMECDEVEWLNRAQHPSYVRQVGLLLAHLAGRVLSIEIVPDGPERWGASIIYMDGNGVTSRIIPLAMALLLASRQPIPVVASAELFEVLPLQ